MEISIIYSSETGNTKMLAEALRSVLGERCSYYGEIGGKFIKSKRIYLGFWTNNDKADAKSLRFLEQLEDAELFLFGTAGYASEDYFKTIIANTMKHCKPSVRSIGSYMCQGKMPASIKEMYEKTKAEKGSTPQLENSLANFDKALSHPDDEDLKALKEAVQKTLML